VEYLLKIRRFHGVLEFAMKNLSSSRLSSAYLTKMPSHWIVKFRVWANFQLTAAFKLSGCTIHYDCRRDSMLQNVFVAEEMWNGKSRSDRSLVTKGSLGSARGYGGGWASAQ
jgi:hypothetical protein